MGNIHCGIASIRRPPDTVNNNKKYYVSLQSCNVSNGICYQGRFKDDGSLTPITINNSSKLVVYSSISPNLELCRIPINIDGTIKFSNKKPISIQIPLNCQASLDFHFYYMDNDNDRIIISLINCESFNAEFIVTEVL
jgi:hypothetical protein